MWTNLKKAPVQINGRVGLLVNQSRGPDCSLLKSQVGGNKSVLYFGGWQLERGQTPFHRLTFLPPHLQTISGQEVL